MDLYSPNTKKFQEKASGLENIFLYFGKWNFLGPSSYIPGGLSKETFFALS